MNRRFLHSHRKRQALRRKLRRGYRLDRDPSNARWHRTSRHIPDRKRQRRDYLKKKGTAYTLQTVGNVVFIPSMTIALLCVLVFVFYEHMNTMSRECNIPYNVSTRFWFLKAGTFAGVMAFASWRTLQTGEKIARIAYVPRVVTENLPAREILVRCAEEPSAAKETLLRPRQTGQETPQEELLRSPLS